jgi:hypothetical protein
MRKALGFLVIALIAVQLVNIGYAQPKRRYSDLRPRFNETELEILKQWENYIALQVRGRIIVSSLNIILYGYLTFFYLSLYRDNKSKFSLGLVSLSIVLLIYSLAANPFILRSFWSSGLPSRQNPIWISVFTFIPDLFASFAAAIMIYLSRT